MHDAEREEVERAMADLGRGVGAAQRTMRAAIMKSGMPMHGLTVPVQRQRLKKGYSFSGLSAAEQLAIWDDIWRNARFHETRMQAGFFAEAARKVDIAAFWRVTRDWIDVVNCWDQSDTLSKIYAEAMEAMPETVDPVLKRWCKDANPWKRRQSVVALIFYARQRRRIPPAQRVLAAAVTLIGDRDHYVQKGVGWALRECSVVHPHETFDFLCARAGRLSPPAFASATEKLTSAQKARLSRLRKSRRI